MANYLIYLDFAGDFCGFSSVRDKMVGEVKKSYPQTFRLHKVKKVA